MWEAGYGAAYEHAARTPSTDSIERCMAERLESSEQVEAPFQTFQRQGRQPFMTVERSEPHPGTKYSPAEYRLGDFAFAISSLLNVQERHGSRFPEASKNKENDSNRKFE